MRRFLVSITFVLCAALWVSAQNPPSPNEPMPRSDSSSRSQQVPRSDSSNSQSTQDEPKTPGEEGQAPAPSTRESSSRDSIIDLSPPKGDDLKHEGTQEAMEPTDSDVIEFKPWNPHKAQKNIEVGDYYAKEKNYRAAISRYREALEYKPKDALATFKLATTLEKVNAYQEARDDYEGYLIILPQGPLADKARQGIERLKDKSKSRSRLTQSGAAVNPTSQPSQNPR